MKKPRLERGPKLSSAIAQPQMMMTSGVRQVPGRGTDEGRRWLSPCTFPDVARPEPPGESYDELMHSHGNPKGSRRKIFALQGSPAKSARAMRAILQRDVAPHGVVPRTPGRHTPRPCNSRSADRRLVQRPKPGVMGPCVGRDDQSYRFALTCSAELCAASASLAEIAAVSAAVPQLGASLPSPQARGR